MSTRAIRFAGAGFAGTPEGLTVTPTGAVAMVSDDDAVRQAIVLLLTTTPGERLMRPDYGSHLRRLAFAPNDHTTAGLAIHYVRTAIERWEPRVEIVDLDADADPVDHHVLTVSLRYRVKASLTVITLDLPVEVANPPSEGGQP